MSNFTWLHFLNAILLIVFTFTLSNVSSQRYGSDIKKKSQLECTIFIEKSLLAADCQKSDFTLIPHNLRTNIKVLYMTTNRLRKLSSESLYIYSSLRYLFLDDNIISHLEEDVFLATPSLEVLDLSLNPLTKLPVSLAQLPHLRRLYLASTELPYIEIENFTINAGKAFSTLEFLSLSSANLKKIPPLGGLHKLYELNISRNGQLEMTTSDFGAACKLKIVDMSGSMNMVRQDTACTCHALRLWFQQTNVQVITENPTNSFGCLQEEIHCTREADEMISEARKARTHCEAAVEHRERTVKARLTWFWIVIGLGLVAFLLLVIISIYCYHRLRRKRLRNASATRATIEDGHHDHVGETSAKLLDSSTVPATTPLEKNTIS